MTEEITNWWSYISTLANTYPRLFNPKVIGMSEQNDETPQEKLKPRPITAENMAVVLVLLVGRDLLKAHHVLDQRIGSDSAPYAQKVPLGWTIVGESCLRWCHPSVNAFKTNILKSGRPSFLEPCTNDIEIKEKMVPFAGSQRTSSSNIGQDVFAKTPDDERISLSRDDRDFLAIMDDDVGLLGQTGSRHSYPRTSPVVRCTCVHYYWCSHQPSLLGGYFQMLVVASLLLECYHRDYRYGITGTFKTNSFCFNCPSATFLRTTLHNHQFLFPPHPFQNGATARDTKYMFVFAMADPETAWFSISKWKGGVKCENSII